MSLPFIIVQLNDSNVFIKRCITYHREECFIRMSSFLSVLRMLPIVVNATQYFFIFLHSKLLHLCKRFCDKNLSLPRERTDKYPCSNKTRFTHVLSFERFKSTTRDNAMSSASFTFHSPMSTLLATHMCINLFHREILFLLCIQHF